jgi:plastocyanin
MRRSTLSIMCLVAMLCLGLVAPLAMAQGNATVSFGQWQTGPPELNRFPDLSPRDRNNHQLIPNEVTIKAGGSVNFIIGGFHNPIVYDDETQPGDIKTEVGVNTANTRGPLPSPPAALIDDPTNRIYRGLDPSLQPLGLSGQFGQDRVEVVFFPKPGTYLVICGVRGHFVTDGMFGFVHVEE